MSSMLRFSAHWHPPRAPHQKHKPAEPPLAFGRDRRAHRGATNCCPLRPVWPPNAPRICRLCAALCYADALECAIATKSWAADRWGDRRSASKTLSRRIPTSKAAAARPGPPSHMLASGSRRARRIIRNATKQAELQRADATPEILTMVVRCPRRPRCACPAVQTRRVMMHSRRSAPSLWG